MEIFYEGNKMQRQYINITYFIFCNGFLEKAKLLSLHGGTKTIKLIYKILNIQKRCEFKLLIIKKKKK